MRFGRFYPVIRRSPGEYVNGEWVPPSGDATSQVKLDIQPSTSAPFRMMETLPEGRRSNHTLAAFAALGTDLRMAEVDGQFPGDIVLLDGIRWIVIAKAEFDSLGFNRPTTHELYLIQREIERGAGEVVE